MHTYYASTSSRTTCAFVTYLLAWGLVSNTMQVLLACIFIATHIHMNTTYVQTIMIAYSHTFEFVLICKLVDMSFQAYACYYTY